MSIGRFIRGLFGPYERQITAAYRSIYVNIDAYVAGIRNWVPDARRILEVGCGEGAVTERLARVYPDAAIVAIDVDPAAGRLYQGPGGRVHFLHSTIQDFAATSPDKFDLIVLADVLHHVPKELRRPLLDTARSLLAPGGQLAFKEWERTFTPIHWLGYLSDRWITGDRISYMRRGEIVERLAQSFGAGSVIAEERIRPWRNNLSMLVRP
jgi:2-polyprenyl-3-methyl-5-hydroxy-6-metoxy-1,4-benzoquinol methylase